MRHIDAIIIGCGPCGIGAALKLKEAGKNVAIIESSTPGGKVNIAPRVDNYPNHTKIPGPELALEFYDRMKKAGIELVFDTILSLKKENLFVLEGKYEKYTANTVLIASGTKERKLGFDNEDKLFGHGISYCAICDGHFFKDQDVAIIGGGNAALKEAIYLAPSVKHLYLIHRRNEFRGLNKLIDELNEMGNVTILTPYKPKAILGDDKVTGLVLTNSLDESEKTLELQGIFPLIGQIPNTDFINIENVKNEWGTIPVDKNMETSCKGLFAGGDVLPREIRQIYLAEHDGMVAAKSMIELLK